MTLYPKWAEYFHGFKNDAVSRLSGYTVGLEIGRICAAKIQNHNISLLKYLIFLVRENMGPILKLVKNDLDCPMPYITTAAILFS